MYNSTSINESPVIRGKATSEILSGAFHAVVFDGNGGIVLAGAGVNALGLLPAETPDDVAAGDDVTVQIEDNGLWKAGGVIAAGAELTSDASGEAVTAAIGNYVTAIALEAAAAAGDIIKVQIVKAGKDTITA